MGNGITLSREEIFQITRKKQPAAQLRVLREMGIRAYRTDDPDQPITVVRDWLAPASSEANAVRRKPMLRFEREKLSKEHGR